MAYTLFDKPKVASIKTSEVGSIVRGKVTEGSNISKRNNILQTTSELTFESDPVVPEQKNANATAIRWSQEGVDDAIDLEIRLLENGKWTQWYEAYSSDDRKDETEPSQAAMLIGSDIEEFQYRFKLKGTEDKPSAAIDLNQANAMMIDTKDGPSPNSKSPAKQLLSALGFYNNVSARADGPRIISREEWGGAADASRGWDPNGSSWTPQYHALYRAVVHHTVTTNNADPAASVRAIWQFHSNGNGWGDIGYNYLVDRFGNIYQGRYFDAQYAKSVNKDVTAGHAYSNNVGTTGIAAIGDFTSTTPSSAMLNSISNIIGYKAHPYPWFEPANSGAHGSNVVGHRNVTSTSCPGEQLYAFVASIARNANPYFYKYDSEAKYDIWYRGQGINGVYTSTPTLKTGEIANAFIDLTNVGTAAWTSDGEFPVRIGTDMPRDRASNFAVPFEWIHYTRPGTFTQKVTYDSNGNPSSFTNTNRIEPGETARFTFKIKAPQTSGSYQEFFQPVAEKITWFHRFLGINFRFNVESPRVSWEYAGQTAYTDSTKSAPVNTYDLVSGQRFYSVIKAKNTGNTAWDKNDPANRVLLATNNPRDRTSNFYDSSWLSPNRLATTTENSVYPGQVGTFENWFRAPGTEGQISSKEHFNLVIENSAWLNDVSLYWDFRRR